MNKQLIVNNNSGNNITINNTDIPKYNLYSLENESTFFL